MAVVVVDNKCYDTPEDFQSSGVSDMRPREQHGMTNTRTYRIWNSMVSRCHNKNTYNGRFYRDIGVTVCDRWRRSFLAFLEDMGEAPEGCSIDRVGGAKVYSKETCRWATRSQQNNNKSNTVYVIIGGVKRPFAEWCAAKGVNYFTAMTRYRAGKPLDIVFGPSIKKRGKSGRYE
jgi:hypothetical protein